MVLNASFPSFLPAAPLVVPPFVVHVRDIVDSTSDDAKALANAGAPHGSVVWAREQSAGRGRYARQWVSPPGNLYMSVVLRPEVAPARTAELGFVAALAVAETVESFLPPGQPALLKWPNDVQVDGRKISGILLEGQFSGMEIAWVVAGIGINVTGAPNNPENPATCLTDWVGGDVAARDVLEILLARLGAWLKIWQGDGFASIRAGWMARAARLNDIVSVRIGTEPLSGRFRGIDHDGALLLETPQGARRVTAGEAAFGPL